MSAAFWGVPGQVRQSLCEIKEVVTRSLGCSHSVRAGWTSGNTRGKRAYQSRITHRQPRRVLLLLALLHPGCTSRAPALIGTGHLPWTLAQGPLVPAAVLLEDAL